MTTTVIKTCRVAPPPGEVAEQSLPLTFFDMTWLHFLPMPQLLFYEFTCSEQHFSESVVPKLKQSLSKTLKHFFPLSGNLIYPLSPEKLPEFRYLSGDSVHFTIAESSDDFDDLVGNCAGSADRLHSFVPKLPPIVEESDRKLFQVFAVQATHFVGRGVAIGIATHHSVSDAPSFLAFITCWASISRLEKDDVESLPICDRSVVKYPTKLDSLYWKNAQRIPLQSRHPSLPTNRIRTTFIFNESEIKKLKGLIQSNVPSIYNISSFVAIAAYIWTGVTKSLRADDDDDDEPVSFLIPIDLRPRMDPPVPENYFGNCLSYALPRVRRRELVGDEGLFLAAEAIAAEIKKRTSDKKLIESAEKWSPEVRAAVQKSYFSVAGSTRLDLYGADFGWGKARKQDILSIDGERYAMTLCKARNLEGGLESPLSLVIVPPQEPRRHRYLTAPVPAASLSPLIESRRTASHLTALVNAPLQSPRRPRQPFTPAAHPSVRRSSRAPALPPSALLLCHHHRPRHRSATTTHHAAAATEIKLGTLGLSSTAFRSINSLLPLPVPPTSSSSSGNGIGTSRKRHQDLWQQHSGFFYNEC